MLLDMHLKLEVIQKDEVAKSANPRPLAIVLCFKMSLEFVKLAKI